MSVMTSFTRRSLAKNRMRTVVSVIGIVLSVALITAIWTTVSSLQQGIYQRTIATEGWWQMYSQGLSDETLDKLTQGDQITDIAVSYDGGVAFFSEEEQQTLGSGIVIKTPPQALKGKSERDGSSITCMPVLTEGRYPEVPGEIMLPERLKENSLGADGSGGVRSDGALGLYDSLTLDVCRYVSSDPDQHEIGSTDDAVALMKSGCEVRDAQGNALEGYGAALALADGKAAEGSSSEAAGYSASEASLTLSERSMRTFTVVGFYDDAGAQFVGNDFVAASVGESIAITAPGGTEMLAGVAADKTSDAAVDEASGAAAGEGSDEAASQEPGAAADQQVDAVSGAATNQAPEAESGIYAEAWVATQGFASVDEMSEFLSGRSYEGNGLDYGNTETYFHINLMRYQGIATDSLVQDSLTTMAGVLAIVVVVASVSLIYNSFSISVAERTRQFGLLASLGASRRQLRLSVVAEALMLGVVGIPVGVLVGIGGTAAVLHFTGAGFQAILGVSQGLSLAVSPFAIVASVVFSLITLLVSAWIPALRAGRVSAVDAIRQTQDVRLPRRARRKAARVHKAARSTGEGEPMPFSKRAGGGLWGAVAGVPGVIAHRNLSRQSARGRIVVASLAVSVVLVVTAGAVSLAMEPFANRADSAGGVSSDADVMLSASSSGSQDTDLSESGDQLNRLIDEASSFEGVALNGVVRQGSMEVAMPAGMLSHAGVEAMQNIHDSSASEWVPRPCDEKGAYYGKVDVFYLDAESFSQMANALGVGDEDFADPAHPRAIALNTYQGVTANQEYLDIDPFAQTGVLQAYYDASIPEGFTSMGVVEGEDGAPALGLLNQTSVDEQGNPLVECASLAGNARSVQIDVVALAPEAPSIANIVSASRCVPVLLLSDELPGAAADSTTGSGESSVSLSSVEKETPYSYSFATASFQADDHAAAAEKIQDVLGEYSGITASVVDLVVDAEQSRLVMQTIQVFMLCFTVIMVLIAVANVFNTLTNSIILRTREFAVLKSVGMGNRTFARMLACECGSYVSRGLVIGLALAVLVAWALYQALGIAFEGVGFTLPWPYVGAAIALVLAVLAISVLFAVRKSRTTNVVEALRADAV